MITRYSTLIYRIKVPVRLLNFEEKPWSMFGNYFWPVKIISIEWLDSWFYFVQRVRIQVNQSKYFLLVKNIHKSSIKVFPQNSVIVLLRLFGRLEYIFMLTLWLFFTGVLTPTYCLPSPTTLYEAQQKPPCTPCSSFPRVKEPISSVTLLFVEVL